TTTRARANSESTISTLVSDTDTVMPGADPTEAITPNSSAHNSFQLPSTSSPVVVGQTHYRLPPATSSGIISACSPPTHQQVLAKGRNMSVIGAGMGVEVRTEKGLSTGLLTFPAAA